LLYQFFYLNFTEFSIMKTIQQTIVSTFSFFLLFVVSAYSQADQSFELYYNAHKIYPPLSMTKAAFSEAETLLDINPYYKPSWVKEYISVTVTAIQEGKKQTAKGIDNKLNTDQRSLLMNADIGTEVMVIVDYIPDNNLKQNEARLFEFVLTREPEQDAQFKGGDDDLKQYLKVSAMDKLSKDNFRKNHLTAVQFTIDESGKVTEAHVAESSGDENVDNVLLQSICKMPDWIPASFENGTKVKQEYVFAAGDKQSCVVNFFNTRQGLAIN